MKIPAIVLFLAVPLALVSQLAITCANAEEFSHEGFVVVYGSDEKLDEIEVQVRVEGRDVVDPMTTESDGKYSFELDKKVDLFMLRFKDKRAKKKYNAAVQEWVQNDAHPNQLDMQGLVSTEQAGSDHTAAKRAHDGNAGYERSTNREDEGELQEMKEYFTSYYTEASKFGDALHDVASDIEESNYFRDGFEVPAWFLNNRDSIR